MSYEKEQYPTTDLTWPTAVNDELWYINFDQCIKNCSSHGDCYFGFCFCDIGYWGSDCSNSSCPGTSCYYDEVSHDQVCVHACQAGYNHTDADTYVQDIAKVPCSRGLPGVSNGICDGYGNSMCAPPFVGSDCSIKDCKDQCSLNGWCSIEYPVSRYRRLRLPPALPSAHKTKQNILNLLRCLCNPGYFGDVCQFMQCLNNCSYPNGMCNTTSGDEQQHKLRNIITMHRRYSFCYF